MFWKSMLALIALAGLGGAAYVAMGGAVHMAGVSVRVKDALKYLGKNGAAPSTATVAAPREAATAPKSSAPWDGLLTLDKQEQEAIGLHTVTVQPQNKPIKLELPGRTAYDPDTLTKIRPRFDALAQKIHAVLGQRVKKGDPLVELYSTDLAQAKSDYQTNYVQWQHDLKLYKVREELLAKKTVSIQQFVDVQNDERKSRLGTMQAKDKLKVLGVPPEEIDHLLVNLGDKVEDPRFGSFEEKAKMVLRSPVDGIVIDKDVVPQNFYQPTDVLMVIAPLDHLWVWINVYELDQDKVRKGQTLDIQFPYLDEDIHGTVQYIANEVSKETRAVRVRATIPNPNGQLKSDMLVKAFLDIPPLPGQTVIPRMAMVTSNGVDYAFVRVTRSGSGSRPDKFQRRNIKVGQENSDTVVVHSGLKAGEEVVTSGSLILSQLYEDRSTVDTGLPLQ
jgi:cobalt-zinc-cadmium efflux system membrane fusion protein